MHRGWEKDWTMCEKKGKVYQKKSRSGGSVLETDFCGALAPRTTRFLLVDARGARGKYCSAGVS